MQENKIIVHALIKCNNGYLVTKRSKEETACPEYWDIPGGLAEDGEMPKEALKREVQEEVNLDVEPTKIIHEDSNYDAKKDLVFIRLVYLCELKSNLENIKLQLEEHSEYKIIKALDELESAKIVPFLEDIFTDLED